MAPQQEPSSPNRKPSRSSNYLRYSGLAFQLLASITIGGWLGYKTDAWLNLKYPVFMLLLGLGGFGGSLYLVYRSFNRE